MVPLHSQAYTMMCPCYLWCHFIPMYILWCARAVSYVMCYFSLPLYSIYVASLFWLFQDTGIMSYSRVQESCQKFPWAAERRTFFSPTISNLVWTPGIWGSGLWRRLSWAQEKALEKEPVIWTSHKPWITSVEKAQKPQMGNWGWESQLNVTP